MIATLIACQNEWVELLRDWETWLFFLAVLLITSIWAS